MNLSHATALFFLLSRRLAQRCQHHRSCLRQAALLALCLSLLLCSACQHSEPAQAPAIYREAGGSYYTSFYAMDTQISLRAYGSGAEAALAASASRLTELEGILSAEQETSELARINQGNQQNPGSTQALSPTLYRVIAAALALSAETDGALDISTYPLVCAWGFGGSASPHLPQAEEIARLLPLVDYRQIQLSEQGITLAAGMQIGLGAIAKGYSADELADLFAEAEGVEAAVISLGGNVQTVGQKPDGSPFLIAINDPQPQHQAPVCILALGEAAIVTSGGYERYFEQEGQIYHHLLDPHSGYPAENGLVSVTVVAKSGTLADAMSTALFVSGREKASRLWAAQDEYEIILIDDQNRVYYSEGLATVLRDCDEERYSFQQLSRSQILAEE